MVLHILCLEKLTKIKAYSNRSIFALVSELDFNSNPNFFNKKWQTQSIDCLMYLDLAECMWMAFNVWLYSSPVAGFIEKQMSQ